MDLAERRVIGALLFLLGVSLLAVGVYVDQLDEIVEMLRKAFETAV